MAARPQLGIFVTGTDTNVGKTFVARGIASVLSQQGVRVGVYKPVASGCESLDGKLVARDAVLLWEAAGKPKRIEDVCPQIYRAAMAPHLSAREEGKEIDQDLLFSGVEAWSDFDFMIIEGVGGLMSPIGDDLYVADLASEFGYPLLVVAANKIGVVNQVLQTLIVASTFRDGLATAGIVLNDVNIESNDESVALNRRELEKHCVPPLLAHTGFWDTDSLKDVDWKTVVG